MSLRRGVLAEFEIGNDCFAAMERFNRAERRRLLSEDEGMGEFGRLLFPLRPATRCQHQSESSPRPLGPAPAVLPAPTPPRKPQGETLTLTTAPRGRQQDGQTAIEPHPPARSHAASHRHVDRARALQHQRQHHRERRIIERHRQRHDEHHHTNQDDEPAPEISPPGRGLGFDRLEWRRRA